MTEDKCSYNHNILHCTDEYVNNIREYVNNIQRKSLEYV